MKLFTRKLIPTLLFFAATFLHAQLEWTRYGSSDYNWTDATNWLDEQAPEINETSHILISSAGYSSAQFQILSIILNTASSQVLQGGLEFQFAGYDRYLPVVDLQGKSLVFDGGMLGVRASTNASVTAQTVTFQNGTVVLGTTGIDGNAASLKLGSNLVGTTNPTGSTNDVRMVFLAGSTLNTANADTISITSNIHNYIQGYTLDLSAANLESGEQAGKMSVENLEIAWFQGTNRSNSRNSNGTLKLGESAQEIEVKRDLVLGVSGKISGDSSTTGILEFTPGLEGERTLSVGHSLLMGVGDRGIGEIKNMPTHMNLNIGNSQDADGDRGVIWLGYNYLLQSSFNSGHSSGTLVGGEGNVTIYVSEMRIGQRTTGLGNTTNGSAFGVLDLRDANLQVLDVSGSVFIGDGLNSQGEVRLKGGEATSRQLLVGRASGDADRSLLQLDGTHWVVEEKLEIGALGDVVIRVATSGGGLDLTSGLGGDFVIQEGGKLTLLLDALPVGPVWGIRMQGDFADLFTTYLGDGRMEATGAYASLAAIYQENGYTYYGIQTIPEPGVLALIPAVLIVGIFAAGKRRNRVQNT